jgi:hypothetical protein
MMGCPTDDVWEQSRDWPYKSLFQVNLPVVKSFGNILETEKGTRRKHPLIVPMNLEFTDLGLWQLSCDGLAAQKQNHCGLASGSTFAVDQALC